MNNEMNEQKLISTAEEYIHQGKHDEARTMLNQILTEINPKSIDALNDLVVVHILTNNFESAIESIERVLEIDPKNETATDNLAYIKQKIDESNDAKAALKEGLSIIIPIYNKKELTLNCLKSLNEIKASVKYEVIIVDNASSDESTIEIEKLKSNLKYAVTYIRNEENLGFAKANNIGSRSAYYNNLLFLNNDIIAKEDFISSSLDILNTASVGIVGIKLLYKDASIQHAGIAFNDQKRPEHIYKYYNGDYELSNRVESLQAVTGACLFIKKDLFEKLQGFDEEYVNGWEDMDLCFRVRQMGLKIVYNGKAKLFHLESQSEGRLNKVAQNTNRFYSKWQQKIISDLNKFYDIKLSGAVTSFTSKFNLPHRMSIAIKIGVPTRKNKNWGDVYYAEALAKELRIAGHNAVVHYLNEWNQSDKQIDVVIHIKGLSKYQLKSHNVNVLWVINHPELHTIDEINSYDLVFIASEKYFNEISDKVTVPVHYLPQATDPMVFVPNSEEKKKTIEILFVGNNYEAKNNGVRKIVQDLLSAKKKYNLHVIGEGWKGFIDDKYIKSEFVEWNKLPELYKSAKIILNDHQKTMKENGFINNRTFDIALTKSFQISDDVEGLQEYGIVKYKNPNELERLVDQYLSDESSRNKKVQENYDKCVDYTFAKRAGFILKNVYATASVKSPYQSCNICGHHGDNFLDMGSRKKVRCPQCHSLERQRALWSLLNSRNILQPGMTVLEVAPLSKRIFGDFIKNYGCTYVCIDKWKSGNPLDKRDTSWIDYEMDICDLKFDDNTFDVVLMQHVIEEVPDDLKAFSEISRVLKQTGVAVLEVPHFSHKRKTYEYYEPRKFGNVREYGVDFYEKIKPLFGQREEERIDSTILSLLFKEKPLAQKQFTLPVLMDHPRFQAEGFKERLDSALRTMNKAGLQSLTTAQIDNYYKKNVFYKNAFWITFDDGKRDDITEALPILEKTGNYATSFVIPNHFNENEWKLWESIRLNRNLDIQSHSYSHRQHFVSDRLIGINRGEYQYANLLDNLSLHGYPIFEYNSALKGRAFIPSKEVIEFSLQFYLQHKEMNAEEYLDLLQNEIAIHFPLRGEYENEAQLNARLEREIISSKDILTKNLSKDIYAFSFPWGQYDADSMLTAKNQYELITGVNPQIVNKNDHFDEINRIDVPGNAFNELRDSLFRLRPWEEVGYKGKPEVCVLMTTYNRQDLIADSIQSVIDQTFKNWNLIIVNDGGDDIAEIIKSFNDPRIKYFSIDHKGKPAALNFAIKKSKSKYIAYLDDDDKYFPNHLEVMITYLENHPERKFVYTYSQEVKKLFSDGNYKEVSRLPKYAYQVNSKLLRYMNHIPNLCALHERSLFDVAGLYDEALEVLIDWDEYRRLALAAEPIFLNICTSEYLRKVTLRNTLEEQMTGMFYTDPVRYYKNRLRVLSKKFASEPVNEHAVIFYAHEKNVKDIRFFLYKSRYFKKNNSFDIVLLVDIELNKDVVNLIKEAEAYSALCIANTANQPKNQFVEDVITSNKWSKHLLFDSAAAMNEVNMTSPFRSTAKVVNYAVSFSKIYPIKNSIQSKITEGDVKVSIIIPTFNNWRFTDKCLNSILNNKNNTSTYEIIVVDNASSDETRSSLPSLQQKYRNLKVLLNDTNLGFSKANNIGAKAALGEYLLFLNNDTLVTDKWLDEMVEGCDKNDDVGIVGAKLLYEDKTIQHSGVAITDSPDPIMPYHIFKGKRSDFIPANSFKYFQAVTGACLLIPKKLFFSVDGFDEEYLNGYEDVDLCFKVGERGKKILYSPKATVIHYESKTPGRFDKVQHNTERLLSKWQAAISKDDLERMFKPRVSIVIPVYNQLEYTKKCIESIIKYTHISYEIIIVDNASEDGTKKYLESLEYIKIVRNDSNKGYPVAINQGLVEATGEYIILMNNDIVLTPNWLDGLIEVAESDPKIGLVGPAINVVSGFQLDLDAQYSDPNMAVEYSKKVRENRRRAWMETPRIAFVCTLIKRDVVKAIGGLDERFSPGNYEDDDYCLRANQAGYNLVIAWDTYIHHFGSKSFKANGEQLYADRLEKSKNKFVGKWGANPDEIWIDGKLFTNRSMVFPIDANPFIAAMKRSMIYLNDKDYQSALFSLNEAIECFDKFSREGFEQVAFEDLLNNAAHAALMIVDYDKAHELFEKELSEDPSSSRACVGLGEAFFLQKKYHEAKEMFEWGVKNDLNNQHAIGGLKKVNGILSTGMFSHEHLKKTGNIVVDRNENLKLKKYLRIIEKAIDEKDPFTKHIPAITSLLEKKQFQDVLRLTNALHLEAKRQFNEEVLILRGCAYLGLEELDQAKKSFEIALEINPKSSEACSGLGEVFYLAELDKESKTMFEWGVMNNGENTTARKGLAKINNALHLRSADNSLLDPKINELINQAEEKINCGETEQARAILAEATCLDKYHLDVLNDLSVCCIIDNENQKALDIISLILTIDPQNEIASENYKFLQKPMEVIAE